MAERKNIIPWLLIIGLLIVVGLVVVVLVVWRPWAATPPPPASTVAGNPNGAGEVNEPPEDVKALLAEARQLHEQEAWCDAKAAWDKALAAISDGKALAAERVEAKRNRDMADKHCQPPKPPVDRVQIPHLPPEERPAPVSAADLLKFYQVGRRTQGVAMLDITGAGTNTNWLWQESANFAHRYQVPVTIDVVTNNGEAVVFRQKFGVMAQLLAVSTERLALAPPPDMRDPIWDLLDAGAEELFPMYKSFKQVKQILEMVDPRLKRTLTFFKDALRLKSGQDAEIAAQVEQFAGNAFELTYVSGLGVTEIKSLGGKYQEDDLRRLARNSSLFMDFFLSEVAVLPAGESKVISTRDIQAMLDFGYDTEAEGSVTLRNVGEAMDGDEKLVSLKVTEGQVMLRANVDGRDRSGEVRVRSGLVRYSPDSLLVRYADLDLEGNASWVGQNHLLLGTAIREGTVQVQANYRAKLIDPGTTVAP